MPTVAVIVYVPLGTPMKIPVVAPVTFTIPLPERMNDGTPTTVPPPNVAVTVAEALIQTDTDALKLSEHVTGGVNTPQLTTTVVVAVHVPTVAVSV